MSQTVNPYGKVTKKSEERLKTKFALLISKVLNMIGVAMKDILKLLPV